MDLIPIRDKSWPSFLHCLCALLALGCCLGAIGAAAAVHADSGKLQVYFIDVEGGQATLFVTPVGQSLLIDTGWPGNAYRDADRIAAAAKQAGLAKLDYVLITHYHDDHVGGVPQLVDRIPVGTFLDHGPNREMDHGITEKGFAEYKRILASKKSKHLTLRPGQTLPIQGMTATVISADGRLIQQPLQHAGAGEANAWCQESAVRPADQTENARSLGIAIDFGKLRLLDLGDLTWDKEMELMCPINRLGQIDVLIVSHHGWLQSSSPALVGAIEPRIAIMDNGAKKGGSLPTFATLARIQGLESLWQLHFADEAGVDHNRASDYIANTSGPDLGHYLKLTADADGTMEMYNSRTGSTRHYKSLAVVPAPQPTR